MPRGQLTPLPIWALENCISKPRHESEGLGLPRYCLHCGWDLRASYPHTAQTDSESKRKAAGEATGTSLWVRVSQTCGAFRLYQAGRNREKRQHVSHQLTRLLLHFLQGVGCICQQGHQWLPEFAFREWRFHSSRFSLSNAKESTNVRGVDFISNPRVV